MIQPTKPGYPTGPLVAVATGSTMTHAEYQAWLKKEAELLAIAQKYQRKERGLTT